MTPIHIKPPSGKRDPLQGVEPPCSCGASPLRRVETQGGDPLALQCPRCGRVAPLEPGKRPSRCSGCGSAQRGRHGLGCPRKPRGGAAATFSACGRYRYVLRRRTTLDGSQKVLLWILLNPSKADATTDDATVRKALGFAERSHYGELVIVNLFAAVATDPRALREMVDPVGPECDAHIRRELRGAHNVICGWGANSARLTVRDPAGSGRTREQEVLALIWSEHVRPLCLGTTAEGAPRHPLYVGYDTKPILWPLTREALG